MGLPVSGWNLLARRGNIFWGHRVEPPFPSGCTTAIGGKYREAGVTRVATPWGKTCLQDSKKAICKSELIFQAKKEKFCCIVHETDDRETTCFCFPRQDAPKERHPVLPI